MITPRRGVINNMLAIFVDPKRFREPLVFSREIEAILSHVKASPPGASGALVMVAGEPELLSRSTRLASGIPIDQATWDEIHAVAEKVGVVRVVDGSNGQRLSISLGR